MNKHIQQRPHRILMQATGAALAVLLLLSGCGKGDEKATAGAAKEEPAGKKTEAEAKELTLSPEEATRAGIKVEPVEMRQQESTIVVTASIQANQDRVARVAPRTAGRITSAPATLGERVRAGQVLASLDSVEVGEAYASLMQARSALRIAEADLKRAQELVVDEIIPRKDFLRAQSEREKAVASERASSDRLRLLGGNPEATARGVSGFSVVAPFSGTVIEKKATVGDLASPSEPLFTLADLSRVWIVADLPESSLAKVSVGAQAKVTVPSYPSEIFSGRVSYMGPAVSRETRTVAARIELSNADGRLKPDMFATATIQVAGDKREVISLPDAAVVIMDGQPSVFVFEKGQYLVRPVQPGERAGGRTAITAGLRPGEQAVTAGAYDLKARKQKSQIGGAH